jgi:beta-fructofuranosidase
MIGHMDWVHGIYDGTGPYPLDYGFDFYAPQSLIDDQGRAILTAWMDMWGSPMPTADCGHHWAGALILPRTIALSGGRLSFAPVQELERYKLHEVCITDCPVEGSYVLPITGCCCALDVRIHAGDSTHLGLKLRLGRDEETVLSYDAGQAQLTLNREKSGQGPRGQRRISLALDQGILALHILLDRSSIEVFAAEGQKVMTGRIYPKEASNAMEVYSNGRCRILSIQKRDIVTG